MYVIIKKVKINDKLLLPVIMLDNQEEIWEFNNIEDVKDMVNILNANTDSGHKYEFKKV